MTVYVLVVHDTLADSFEVEDVFSSESAAEQAMEELTDKRLSLAAFIVEREVI